MALHIDPVIREIVPEDYEMLIHFFDQNNVPEVLRVFHPFSLDEKSAYRIVFMERLNHYYVALTENTIIGFCMLRGWDEGYSIPSFGILVDRKFQSLGVGRRMTAYAIEEARRLGCHRVRLSVYSSNKVAVDLYTSMGFVEDQREIVEVMGDPDEKIIMSKNLLNQRYVPSYD